MPDREARNLADGASPTSCHSLVTVVDDASEAVSETGAQGKQGAGVVRDDNKRGKLPCGRRMGVWDCDVEGRGKRIGVLGCDNGRCKLRRDDPDICCFVSNKCELLSSRF